MIIDDARHAAPPSSASLSTDPLCESGLALPAADPVTALRIIGGGELEPRELPLAAQKHSFTLGKAPEPLVDLSLPSAYVSQLHAVLQRKGNRLWVVDQTSTNGTFLKNRREAHFEIVAGDVFRVADVMLLALDDQLRLLRPRLQWALGLRADAAVDGALAVIADGGPLLLIGRPGCEARALADDIHRTSARRFAAFVDAADGFATRGEQAALLRRADQGTMFVDLHAYEKLPAFLVSHLFDGASSEPQSQQPYHIRPIVLAASVEHAEKQLGTRCARECRPVGIPALAERKDEIPRLLDGLFIELKSARRICELGEANVAALRAFAWPQEMEDLRRAAPRLLAIIEHRTLSGAARALAVARQTLSAALDRLGVDVNDD